MIEAESESVEYIGRQMEGDNGFVRREPEVIEIDWDQYDHLRILLFLYHNE